MSDNVGRRIASSIVAGAGLIALTQAAVGGWYFLLLAVVPLACLFVLSGIVALFRS